MKGRPIPESRALGQRQAVAAPASAPRRPAPARRPTQRSTQWVLFGSLASGIGALAFQAYGVERLGEQAFAPITVLWTLQYLASTIALYPTEAYITRTQTLTGGDPSALRGPLRVITVWVTALAVGAAAVLFVFRDGLLAGLADLALVGGLIIASYGAFFVIKGRMAGSNRFRSYGAATAVESVARILVAVPLLLLAPSTEALAWTMPVGVLLVAAWWLYDRGRAHMPEPSIDADLVPAAAGGFLAATTVANIASQMLLAGGPLVVALLDAPLEERSRYFAVITAARVPLVFAIGGLLSRLLPPLTRMARAGDDTPLRRLALRTPLVSLGLGAVAAVAGYLAGPPIVELVLRTGRPSALFVAMTAFGVVLATGSLLLNQVLIARERERRLVLPWVAALGVAVLALVATSGTPTFRMSVAFVTGEVVALAGLLAMLVTLPRSRVEAPEPRAVAAAPLAEP